jgi:hypothetical protein
VIRSLQGIGEYVGSLAKSVYSRGFDVDATPAIDLYQSGLLAFEIVGTLPGADRARGTEINLQEMWRPLSRDRWTRDEYTYDLVDRPGRRRRAFHLHDRERAEARLGVAVHEHCEETLGEPTCSHYVGRELPDGHVAIDLLVAAWVEPGLLGCDGLRCLTERPATVSY